MAAGLGFKTFNTGEVLTSADVNGYLMQGVLVFASEAARNAAITSPQEGQFAYTKDNNSLWYYTGSAWAASGATGDIEGVTAGTGISGGGTSGTVTITNSMATEIDAKGDLIVGTGADTFARLAVGTNGHTLVADSSVSPTGLKWAAPAGGGKVLQVVYATYNTGTTVATTTYTDTGLTASITPSAATSKILIFVNQSGQSSGATRSDTGWGFRIVRNSTTIFTPNPNRYESGYIGGLSGSTEARIETMGTAIYLDDPNTTSATSYKTQAAPLYDSGGGVAFLNRGVSHITLMEIGA